ncbi:MAG: hypothetical protein ACMUIE_03435 [Thermoplasmatota archaeon]
MTEVSGKPIYMHHSQMDNNFLKSMRLLAAICIATWILLAALHNDTYPWKETEALLRDPLFYMLAVSGSILFMLILLFPFLFIQSRFKVTSTGIQTSYSAVTRLVKGHPRFIEYRDIEVIFPQFVPGLKYPDGKKDPDPFYSIVIKLKDGRRLEIPWGKASRRQSKENLEEFRKLFSRCPRAFLEKWSDLPVLSTEQRKISKYLESEDEKSVVMTPSQKWGTIVGAVFFILIFVPFMTALIQDGLDLVWRVAGVCVSILLIFPTFLCFYHAAKQAIEVQKTRASLSIINAHSKGEHVGVKDIKKEEKIEQEKVKFDPVSKEELEKAMKAFRKYNPVRNTIALIGGLIGFIGGIIVLATGTLFWPLFVLGPALIMGGIILIILLFAKMGAGDIDLHKLKMRAALADEVSTGKDILPKYYKIPKWFFMRRGPKPVRKEELDKIRKWTRFSNTQQLVITIVLATGGVVLMMLMLPLIIFIQDLVFIFPVTVVITLVGFPLGFVFMFKSSNAMQRLNSLVQWEERSGVKAVPDDLRKRWEEWEKWRKEHTGT